MDSFVDTAIKLAGLAASMCASAAGIAWWIGSKLDKITTEMLRLELRLAQRLTRLEVKIFNRVGDESHDD